MAQRKRQRVISPETPSFHQYGRSEQSVGALRQAGVA